ncbi:MAG: LLM class F420-dependent oxidoreductase [Litorilinea sp.]
MKIGVVYPQTEYSNDPGAIREYAQTVENLGFSHVLAYDHVLGANPNRPGGWKGPYTHESAFQEVFVLFGFMAAVTTRLEFATGILILPQRQTALVAKQAATLDVLSGGRLRLGVGIGWNEVEYTALNENFGNRGKRSEEQVQVLQKLWTEPLVTFEGKYHTIPNAGLKPMPVQQPIPIWFGGQAAPVMERLAKYGAGWMPNVGTPAAAAPVLEVLDTYLAQAGRKRSDIGIEPRLTYKRDGAEQWAPFLADWQAVGATHFSVNTMGCGFKTPAEHLAALEEVASVLNVKADGE